MFVDISDDVKQGTKLKMSTEGFDIGRFVCTFHMTVNI